MELPTKEIRTVFGQYSNSSNVKGFLGNIELEARFGSYYDGEKFNSSVSKETFNRVMERFESISKPEIVHQTDYNKSFPGGVNVRKTVIEKEDYTPTWSKKERLKDFDQTSLAQYGVRLSISLESTIAPIEPFSYDSIRDKHRRSFIVSDGYIRIDLTYVNMQVLSSSKDIPSKNPPHKGRPPKYPIVKESRQFTDKIRYEIEVESLKGCSDEALKNFIKVIRLVLFEIQGTNILYNVSMRDNILVYVNNLLLSERNQNQIDNRMIARARNLRFNDMVYGGLVGNPDTTYTVTVKADGIRKLLVFAPSGIWLVMAPSEFSWISSIAYPELTGTILDGELVPKSNRKEGAPESKYWFLTFDCIVFNGDRSIAITKHKDRMIKAQRVANLMSDFLDEKGNRLTNTLLVETKTFAELTTVDNFYDTMNNFFIYQKALYYKDDGFIFTPEMAPYNLDLDEDRVSERSLVLLPDLVKWKPLEKMTIDFSIRWIASPGGRKISLDVSDRGILVPFIGSRKKLFDGNVDSSNEMTQNLPTGSIVEYRFDFVSKMFIPVRLRSDKHRPNKLNVAVDNWDWIIDPITEDVLKGKEFKLVYKYHNRIKRALFESVIPPNINNSNNLNNLTLLDIGSGLGGDVSKWLRFSKVVAVEPDKTKLEELRRRIDNLNMKDRVHIVNTGGEDTSLITKSVNSFLGGQADVISMMFSLTFFWKNREILNDLAETIDQNLKPGGTFIFMTLDGDSVSQIFNPAIRGLGSSELIFYNNSAGPITIKYNGNWTSPSELYIDIPGSIVDKQTEWLVFITDLITFLGENYIPSGTYRADKESFLTREERIYSPMYSYGTIFKEE